LRTASAPSTSSKYGFSAPHTRFISVRRTSSAMKLITIAAGFTSGTRISARSTIWSMP
jgi:hypothetical protein